MTEHSCDHHAPSEEERAKWAAEAERIRTEQRLLEISLQRELRKEAEELTADKYHHTVVLDQQVADSSVKAIIRQMASWVRQADSPLTIQLTINSPGGDIFAGFALIDYINSLHEQGHTVNTHSIGMAASMAGVILQAGRTRSMGHNAFLLIHQAQFGAVGSYGEVEDRMKLVNLLQERILDIFASRSKLSKASLRRKWHRRDWWISSAEALKLGLIDRVV
jgi:ATP-dependent Clp protease protease subunit